MRWAGLVVIACGCNQLFGIERTETLDARPPPMCPPIGTLPTFYGQLQQIPVRYCTSYLPSSDSQVALAVRDTFDLVRGPVDHAGSPITLTPVPLGVYRIRPMPEGDRVLVTAPTITGVGNTIAEYVLAPDDTATGMTTFPIGSADGLSLPSHGPDRRVVYQPTGGLPGTGVLVELADTGAGWVEVTRYPLSELVGTDPEPSAYDASLSTDGLRLVFAASQTVKHDDGSTSFPKVVYYADRATTDDHFGTARVLDDVPQAVDHPYLTADCGRLYFSALDTVFFLE